MEKAFKNLIKSEFPYLCNTKLLLAISGGIDSVVLAHLCKKAKLKFSMAHCNFNLRGDESDADENFVVDLADALEVEVFTESFDTKSYAEDAGISIQMAARELRYNWFEDLSSALNYDYILVGHHANDDLETFLINLIRGTGLEGLTGIKPENNKIIRPLLNFSRREIGDYASQNSIKWTEDSSNISSKYLRNKIRHQIIPVMQEINPHLLESFAKTQIHLNESMDLIEDYIDLLYPEIVSKTNYGLQFKIDILKKTPNPKAVLYQLLKPYGFTEWDDVHHLLEAQPGKMVFSETHRLIKDREFLILTEKPELMENEVYSILEGEEFEMLPMGTFSFNDVEKISETPLNCIYVAREYLKYPLTLRKWEVGDIFYPFGMKGKKKLSDFFKDEKLSLPEKENIWLLCSEGKIVWVVNHRADARFAITDPSQKIIKITYSV